MTSGKTGTDLFYGLTSNNVYRYFFSGVCANVLNLLFIINQRLKKSNITSSEDVFLYNINKPRLLFFPFFLSRKSNSGAMFSVRFTSDSSPYSHLTFNCSIIFFDAFDVCSFLSSRVKCNRLQSIIALFFCTILLFL